MKWITHLVTAFCFVYIISKFLPITCLGFLIAMVASIIPDYFEIVYKVRHRSVYFHNWLIPLATIVFIANPTLIGIPLGYGHHLALDSLTKMGVYVGSKRKVKGFLYATNYAHNALIVLIHYVVLMLFLTS